MAPTTTITSTDNENHSPKGVYKGTREEWLEEAMHIMGDWINRELHVEDFRVTQRSEPTSIAKFHAKRSSKPKAFKQFDFKPNQVQVSCSLQDTGMTQSRALAHVHLKDYTGNKKHEIRIGVHVGGRKTKASSSRVADILLHEMIHTCFPTHGHKGGFKHLAKALGLEGKMTATVAGEALQSRIKLEVIDVLGKYPHKAVKLVPRGQRGKGSRLLKIVCLNDCGVVLRASNKVMIMIEGGLCPHCESGELVAQ